MSAEATFLYEDETALYEGRPIGYPDPRVRLWVYFFNYLWVAGVAVRLGEAARRSLGVPLNAGWMLLAAIGPFVAFELFHYARWRSTVYVVTSGGRVIAFEQLPFTRARWTRHLDGLERVVARPKHVVLEEADGPRSWILRLSGSEAENVASALRRATGLLQGYPVVQAEGWPDSLLTAFVRRWWRKLLVAAILIAAAIYGQHASRADARLENKRLLSRINRAGVTKLGPLSKQEPGWELVQILGHHEQLIGGDRRTYLLWIRSHGSSEEEHVQVRLSTSARFFERPHVHVTVPRFSEQHRYAKHLRRTLEASGVSYSLEVQR